MAARAGIGFTPLDNGFAAVDDVAAVQAICDSFDETVIWDLAAKWMAILPCPFTAEDTAAGYRYEVSVLQAEFSLTQVLDAPVTGRIFFEQVIRDNLDIGRPDQVGLIFARRIIRKGPRATPGRFRTRVITEGVVPDPAYRLQAFEDQAVPQGRQSAQNGDHDQRQPRLRHRQAAR